MKKKEITLSCWVGIDGVKFFGPGGAELLELIAEWGSISKAAKAMGMSYKKAWYMIDEMNSLGQRPYVIASKGGKNGGATTLTETGKKAVKAYNKLLNQLSLVVNRNTDLINHI
jgi:molybdate transport system regulatory protein